MPIIVQAPAEKSWANRWAVNYTKERRALKKQHTPPGNEEGTPKDDLPSQLELVIELARQKHENTVVLRDLLRNAINDNGFGWIDGLKFWGSEKKMQETWPECWTPRYRLTQMEELKARGMNEVVASAFAWEMSGSCPDKESIIQLFDETYGCDEWSSSLTLNN